MVFLQKTQKGITDMFILYCTVTILTLFSTKHVSLSLRVALYSPPTFFLPKCAIHNKGPLYAVMGKTSPPSVPFAITSHLENLILIQNLAAIYKEKIT